MKKIIKIISAAVVLISAVKCNDILYNKNIEMQEFGLTISEAKELFKQRVMDYEKIKEIAKKKQNIFIPDDYTPMWSSATQGQNEHIWSMDVTVNPKNTMMVFHTDEEKPWYASVTRKLVITKNKKDNRLNMYILTLIPDKNCCDKHKHGREKLFIHAGDTHKFTGTAIYTLWEGSVICINEHGKQGIKRVYTRENAKKSKSTVEVQLMKKPKIADYRLNLRLGEFIPMGGGGYGASYEDGGTCNFCGEPISDECFDYNCCRCYGWYDDLDEITVNPEECTWCGQYLSNCTCSDWCDACGFPSYICICGLVEPPDYSCPFCGSEYCSGECQNGNGGDDGNTVPPSQPPPQDPHAYDDWNMDDKTKEELTPALDSIEKDCAGKKMLESIAKNLTIRYDPTIPNLLQYKPSTNTLSWFMYTDDGIQMYGLFHELFHAYQKAQGRMIVSGGKTMNLMNLEVEAMIAAYKYVKKHGINESENEHCTIWNEKEKEKFDNYLDNPTADNYNNILDIMSNLSGYQQYKDRVMDDYRNTDAMDILFDDCEDYEN
jgi:hypothetical protein